MKKFGIFLLLFILTGCSSDETTLVLDYVPNTNHTGIYVAKDLGYYEDEGINLKIIGASDVSGNLLAATNKTDFAISVSESIVQFNSKDNKVKSVLALQANNTSGLLSLGEKEINTMKDYENKTYCGWGSDYEGKILDTIFDKTGVDKDSVEIITSSVSLVEGKEQCDFIWAFEGWDKLNIEMQGYEVNFDKITDYAPNWYTPNLVTSNKMIEDEPEKIQSFVNATIKGYEYAAANPSESAEILLKYTKGSDEKFINESQKFLSSNYLNEENRFGEQKDEIWSEFMKWLNDNQLMNPDLIDEKMYTNEFYEGYYDSNK